MKNIKLEDYKGEKIAISFSRDLSELEVLDMKNVDFDNLIGVVSAHEVCMLKDYKEYQKEDTLFIKNETDERMALRLSRENEIILPDKCYKYDLSKLSTNDLIEELGKRKDLRVKIL